MIDEKKIEEAVKVYFGKNVVKWFDGGSFILPSDTEEIFKTGANWAINEFLKDLWKGPEIEPKPNSEIIAISYKNLPIMFYNEDTYDWKHFFKSHNIERWCYLDDILS